MPAEQIEDTISREAATQTQRAANFNAFGLVPQDGRRIGIFSKGSGISPCENFDHPTLEVIHRVILDRAEAAVIFFAGFIEITAQPIAYVFIFPAQTNILGPQ